MDRKTEIAAAWTELHQADVRLRAELSRCLEADAGMSLAEQEVLRYLANAADRRLRMYDMADLLMISRSGVTRLVDRLERRGWVVRHSPDDDRRVIYAVLTVSGLEAFTRSLRVVGAVFGGLFADRLTDRDVTDLRRVLGKLLRRIDLAGDC